MNYIKITTNDIANGPGVRVVLWVSGCNLHCAGCHNPQSWDYDAGESFTKDTLLSIIDEMSRPEIAGLTLSGGHPIDPRNLDTTKRVVSIIKELFPQKSIWLYTGYTWEAIRKNWDTYKEVIENCDVVVDGPYVEELRNISLRFRGSSNQRLIDVKETLKAGEVVEVTE